MVIFKSKVYRNTLYPTDLGCFDTATVNQWVRFLEVHLKLAKLLKFNYWILKNILRIIELRVENVTNRSWIVIKSYAYPLYKQDFSSFLWSSTRIHTEVLLIMGSLNLLFCCGTIFQKAVRKFWVSRDHLPGKLPRFWHVPEDSVRNNW